MEAYKEFYRRYFDFKGYSTRSEYWIPILVNAVVLGLMQALFGDSLIGMLLVAVLSLAVLVPTIAVLIRRLRDSSKTPMYLLWLLVPIIGEIIILIALIKE